MSEETQIQKVVDQSTGKELDYQDLVKIINELQVKMNQLSAIDAKVRYLIQTLGVVSQFSEPEKTEAFQVYNNELAKLLVPALEETNEEVKG